MKNKLFKLQENLKSQIEKIDSYVKKYTDLAPTSSMPSVSYLNWGIKLADDGDVNAAIDKLTTATLMLNQNPSVYVNLGIAFLKQKKY